MRPKINVKAVAKKIRKIARNAKPTDKGLYYGKSIPLKKRGAS